MMNIQNIDINLIDQHPENPRKDLGDLRAERADTSAGSILKRTACAAVRLMKIALATNPAKDKPQNADLLLWRIEK